MSKLFKFKDIFLVPNLITILRFFLIAPMIITFQNGMQNYFLIILTVSLLTDFLDGIAARLLDQKSELGKTLDPIADGITLFAFIILFNREGFISNWFTIFYFLRQLTILIFSLWYLSKLKTVYGSNILGKTGVCFLGAALCVFALRLDNFIFITPYLLNISAILLFVSLLDYIRFFLKLISFSRKDIFFSIVVDSEFFSHIEGSEICSFNFLSSEVFDSWSKMSPNLIIFFYG